VESAITTIGDVDSKISTAKSQVTGNASTDYNTLEKLETKIKAEVTRATGIEEGLQSSITSIGNVDNKISASKS
jgi:type VII secretion effector (TIGR04197 family)